MHTKFELSSTVVLIYTFFLNRIIDETPVVIVSRVSPEMSTESKAFDAWYTRHPWDFVQRSTVRSENISYFL